MSLCPHFGVCGGCQLQDVPYVEQLARKTAWLRQVLGDATGGRPPRVEAMAGLSAGPDGQPWRFRHKVSFVFGPGLRGRGLVMGHFARESNTIVPVEQCPVHSDRGNRLAFAVRDAMARAGIPAAGPRLDGVLRHVIVRTTADERQAVVMLVVTHNDKRLRAPVRALMAGPGAPDGFVINVHDRPGPFMVGRESQVVAGRGQVRETRLGPAFLVSPAAFFQTNVDAAAVLLGAALEAAPAAPRLRILDLYSGSGLFGLPLAMRGHDVTMVEENAQAMRDAAANLRANRVSASRVRTICGRVEDVLARSTPPADLVILDPPREGCHPRVIEAVFHDVRPPRAIYVSCNPEAFAAELPVMLDAGYRLTRVLPVDMFPHTDHVECLVMLEGQRAWKQEARSKKQE